jgi:hypothetical protein
VLLVAGPQRVELEAGQHGDNNEEDDDDAEGAASLWFAGRAICHERTMSAGRARYSVWYT